MTYNEQQLEMSIAFNHSIHSSQHTNSLLCIDQYPSSV